MSKLTAKQQRFVDEYLVDLNATQAAIRAGYSQRTAGEMGYENLKKPQIAEAIETGKVKRSESTGIDAAWVLREAQRSYEINAREVFDEDGNPKQVNPQAARGFLELAGKHVGVQAFKDKVEQETTFRVDMSDIAEAATEADAADAYLTLLKGDSTIN